MAQDAEEPPLLPLGVGAYERQYGRMPEIQLINRFFEENPTNVDNGAALLSRPGSTFLAGFGAGPIRNTFSQEGTFNGDAFVVSGGALFRYTKAGVKTTIPGTIANSPATPSMAGTDEFLFIADGSTLQFFDGVGSRAEAVLTVTGAVSNGETVVLNGFTYTFNTVLGGAGSVLIGSGIETALQNLADAVNSIPETVGIAYGTGTLPNTFILSDFSPTIVGTGPNYTLTFYARTGGVVGNAYTTTETMVNGSFGGGVMSGGVALALSGIPTPDDVAIVSLTVLGGFLLALVANSQTIYFIRPGEILIDPLDFFSSESLPDEGINLMTIGDQFWCFNKQSTDAFYLSGDNDNPFAVFQGRSFTKGALEGTPVRLDPEVVVVGHDGIVYAVGGSGAQRISNHGIEERIRKARKEDRLNP